jgi:SAM-dependent methyltransferase
MPRGLRDTREWYRHAEPLSQVDPALVDWVAERAGPRILDLGSGPGGYSRVLGERGFDCHALDVMDEYVEAARSLGVRADRYDGERVPLADRSVDTVILIEVVEHLEDPAALLAEAARVASRNVLLTTPDCTQSFPPATVEFSPLLDLDHRQFFTVESLRALLGKVFERFDVRESHPLDRALAGGILPRPLLSLYVRLARAGAIRPRYYSRLLGEGRIAGGPVR